MLLQAVTGGGLVALVVTFLLAVLFYAVTLHLAATFFIGDVPSQQAAYAAVVPAVVSILLQQYGLAGGGPLSSGLGVAVVVVVTLLADAIAISFVYGLKATATAALTLLHFGFAAVLGVALNNIFGLV
jgi:hypothetical protein